MTVWTVGGDDPEVAVIACLHGDEVCGKVAVERLRDELDAETVDRPLALVIANDEAVDRGVRHVDVDLNRVFPGDPDSDDHERRLAFDLAAVLEGCEAILDLHSTESVSPPFAIVHSPDRLTLDLARATGLEIGVDVTAAEGEPMLSYLDGVAVECGFRGSNEAATVATDVARTFLRTTGVLPGTPDRRSMTWYRVDGAVPKDDREWTVAGSNFELVREGTVFARCGDETMRAADDFYPVLMSADGYESILGFTAHRAEESELLTGPGTSTI